MDNGQTRIDCSKEEGMHFGLIKIGKCYFIHSVEYFAIV